jgi:carbonic anhydrase/acetyltransferase-like protein (isoleucine patch superfamily)
MMIMGAPAKPVRELTEQEKNFLQTSARDYVKTAQSYSKR